MEEFILLFKQLDLGHMSLGSGIFVLGALYLFKSSILSKITNGRKHEEECMSKAVNDLRDDVKLMNHETREYFEGFKKEIRSDFEGFKKEVREDFKAFKKEVKEDIKEIRNEVKDLKNKFMDSLLRGK